MAKQKERKSLLKPITTFIDGVKKEAGKILWTSKKSLLKYSIATLVFMIFICLFFVATDLLIALLSYVKELIS